MGWSIFETPRPRTARDQRGITERYHALCAHYGMQPSRNNPGRGHENGSIEAPHRHLKRSIGQLLKLHGSSDSDSLDAY